MNKISMTERRKMKLTIHKTTTELGLTKMSWGIDFEGQHFRFKNISTGGKFVYRAYDPATGVCTGKIILTSDHQTELVGS